MSAGWLVAGRCVAEQALSFFSPLVFALTLSACALTAPHPPPRSADAGLEIPSTWSPGALPAAGTVRQAAEWWQRFDDPLLAGLVDRARHSNRNLHAAMASLDQARALRDVAASALWPSLSATGSLQTSRAGGITNGLASQAALGAGYTPDVSGLNRFALGAANSDVDSSLLSLEDVRGALSSETALSYIVLRGLQVRLAIAVRNLDSQLETRQITAWRHQAGLVTMLEVEQARAASEQTRAQLPVLQLGIDQALHALRVLTGDAPMSTDTLNAQLLAPGPVPQPMDRVLPAVPATVLRQRPDVRAAEARVTAAWARSLQAEAARKPGFSISGSLGLGGVSLASLGQGASVFTSLLAGVNLPLFDGGAARARVRAQEAAWEQARMLYQGVVLTAIQQVADALVAFRQDEARLLSLQQAAEAATVASALARQRFSAGLIDFQVVLETQRTQLSTQDSHAAALATLSLDQVRLYKALGGGWPSAADQSPTSGRLPPATP